MAKNYIRFSTKNNVDWAFFENGRILPLGCGDLSTKEFLEFLKKKKSTKLKPIPPEKISILSPITAPCQILCQGANYRQHLIESGLNPDDKNYNLFFTKSDASLFSPIGNVVRPSHVKLLDYEIELGLVFGKRFGSDLDPNPENVISNVAAFFMANDVSARDVQLPQLQWYKGKSYRTFCPAGPHLAVLERGDFDRLNSLELKLTVNGEVRQNDTASNLVFKPVESILELSRFCNISPGDVLLTGTPSGCALRAPGKFVQALGGFLSEKTKWKLFVKGQNKRSQYLRPGDVVRSTIRTVDGKIDLGEQILNVIDESSIE
ncbi:fumarylacetoacetate hydrolase family protein [Leptospira gomenensis]|uniref:Fumarylacetoacetate hydrolase family protein n=1 Tax=Leptospira gomenensis TaxID=2484974 RepID=A0A5F1YI44_9LEPT|nr:fumarylacetoacetate hydrolase family protein [Leptospira gomenensis]TGK34539.1 fumarylacetoacetate hydrolase family protein [Leptospira gomenensis]TGK40151.1 fumarylacetoacetate hydrolase family protein [Leptospira gomenensis]TGK42680.1 fumarylacetoacetate hydrolase family protein [Leptospira gomenensis]TGK55660.1 fumarylacetoacetate hydrolase family protein [Leptospira gomenensis]